MSTDSDIRTALRQVADQTAAPAIDHAGFDRRLRRHRRRRRAKLAGATAAVAAVALAVPVAVSQIDSNSGATPTASGPAVSDRSPAYFLIGQEAMMLDPSGAIHDVGLRADGIVAETADGVILSSLHGLVRLRATRAGEDWSFERLSLPVQDVQSAALSADGAHLAVIDLDEDLVVYDLETGDIAKHLPNVGSAAVLGFSDRVLWTVDNALILGTGDNAVELPLHGGSPMDSAIGGWQLGATVVAVGDWSTTRLYEIVDGEPVEIGRVAGKGDLSPDGRYYLSAPEESAPELWERGEARRLSGLEGVLEQVRWLDDDTALAVVGDWRGQPRAAEVIYLCEAETAHCSQVYDAGTTTVWIGD